MYLDWCVVFCLQLYGGFGCIARRGLNIHIYVCIFISIYIRLCMHLCMYVCVYDSCCFPVGVYSRAEPASLPPASARTSSPVRVCICIFIFTYVYIQLYIYLFMYVFMNLMYFLFHVQLCGPCGRVPRLGAAFVPSPPCGVDPTVQTIAIISMYLLFCVQGACGRVACRGSFLCRQSVYVYIFIYVYVYIYEYIHSCIYLYIYIYLFIYVCMYL